jgi:N6-L-threonylcarbamoyladenine synthase
MQESDQSDQTKADIACAFETAVVETIAIKCRRALQETNLNRLVISGGVSANLHLRQRLEDMVKKEKAKVYYPRLEFCTDNGAMIAFAGCQRLMAGQKENLVFTARPRWSLDSLSPA